MDEVPSLELLDRSTRRMGRWSMTGAVMVVTSSRMEAARMKSAPKMWRGPVRAIARVVRLKERELEMASMDLDAGAAVLLLLQKVVIVDGMRDQE